MHSTVWSGESNRVLLITASMNGDSCLHTMAKKKRAEENLKVDMRVVFILHYYVGDPLCNVHICNDVECSFSLCEGYLSID